jgi:hypothetical protein
MPTPRRLRKPSSPDPLAPHPARDLVFAALTEGAVRWQSVAEVACLSGLEPTHARRYLIALNMAGLLDVLTPGPVVCLSVLGAWRLGAVVVETRDGVPMWDRSRCDLPETVTEPQIPAVIPFPIPHPDPDDRLFTTDDDWSLADPAPGPLEQVIAAEEAELRYQARQLPSRDPYPEVGPVLPPLFPAHILGIRDAWNHSNPVDPANCPHHNGRELALREYCARCDAWGPDTAGPNGDRGR